MQDEEGAGRGGGAEGGGQKICGPKIENRKGLGQYSTPNKVQMGKEREMALINCVNKIRGNQYTV